MKVRDILPKVKANRYTYYNLTPKQVIMYQDLYSYLKKHKDVEVRRNIFQFNDALQGQVNYWLNNKNETDYLKKYKAMELVAYNLNN